MIFSLPRSVTGVVLFWNEDFASEIIIFALPTDKHHHRLGPLKVILSVEFMTCDEDGSALRSTMAASSRYRFWVGGHFGCRALSLSSHTVFCHMGEIGFSEEGSDTMKFSEREKYSVFLIYNWNKNTNIYSLMVALSRPLNQE